MCGIAGLCISIDQRKLRCQAMCDEIRHRGPDDDGVYVDRGCGIDAPQHHRSSTGHQPLSNEDGSVWIVFNANLQLPGAGPA
jgi:asparagine synthase (glutamine-hydrolysing)